MISLIYPTPRIIQMNTTDVSIDSLVKSFIEHMPLNGVLINRDSTDLFICGLFNEWFENLSNKTEVIKQLEHLRDHEIINIPINVPGDLAIPLPIKRAVSGLIKEFLSFLNQSGTIKFGYIPGSVHPELGVYYAVFDDISQKEPVVIRASQSVNAISVQSYASTFISLVANSLAEILSLDLLRRHFSTKYSSYELSVICHSICTGMGVAKETVSACGADLALSAGAYIDKEAASLAGSLFPKPQALEYLTIKSKKARIKKAIANNKGLAAFFTWGLFEPESSPDEADSSECDLFNMGFDVKNPMKKGLFAEMVLSLLNLKAGMKLKELHPRVGFRLLTHLEGFRKATPEGYSLGNEVTEFMLIANSLLNLDINHSFYLASAHHLRNLEKHSGGRAVAIVEAFDRVVQVSKGAVPYRIFGSINNGIGGHFRQPASRDQEFALMYDFCMSFMKDNPQHITLMAEGVKRESYQSSLQKNIERALRLVKKMSFDNIKRHAFKAPELADEVFARVCAENEWSIHKWKQLAHRALKSHNPELFSRLVSQVIRSETAPDETFLRACMKPRLAHLAEDVMAGYATRLSKERLRVLYAEVEKGHDFALKRLLLKAGAPIDSSPDAHYLHPQMDTREYKAIVQSAMLINAMGNEPVLSQTRKSRCI